MRNNTDHRGACLEAAISTQGIHKEEVIAQAQKYYEFVIGARKPIKRKANKIHTGLKSALKHAKKTSQK